MNRGIWRRALLLQVFCAVPTFGSLFHPIDTTNLVRCDFSNEGQNRILVQGGRIQKVIFPPGGIDVQMEEESGQVFVYSLDQLSKPITLSVVTDLCDVQDIEINFRSDIPSEVVILLPPPCPCEDAGEPVCTEVSQDIGNILQDIFSQRAPLGYQCFNLSNESFRIKRGIVAKALSRFDREHESLYLIKVNNCAHFSQTLQEQDIARDGCRWIYLEKRTLPSKGSALAVVSVYR